MIKEMIQTLIFIKGLFTNSPILALSLVNITNGTTAKLNCIDKITWLKTNNSVVPFSPYNMVTIRAGITAINLVIKRLNHGFSLIFKKPSITICPARVPVSVEFCPEASNAMAKAILAIEAPKIGVSIL